MITYLKDETLLSIENVTQKYGNTEVLSDVNAIIKNNHCNDSSKIVGQIVAFLGPSGSGKTQLLRIIAGLQKPTQGNVYIDPDKKEIKKGMCGVVFQTYPLFRNRTILSNLIVAGKTASMKHNEAKNRSEELLSFFELEQCSHKYPDELSGGMRQRASIAQQLINMGSNKNKTYTHLLLMDEPFAALDIKNVQKMCKMIRKIADMNDTNTIIIVTHDIRAALSIGDTVWLMGRNRDCNNKICSGGRIIKELDLINQGLVWNENIETLPSFITLEKEIREIFYTL